MMLMSHLSPSFLQGKAKLGERERQGLTGFIIFSVDEKNKAFSRKMEITLIDVKFGPLDLLLLIL